MWKNIQELNRPQITIWHTHIAFRIPKATDTQKMQYFLLFHCNNGCMNAPQCYIVHILPVLFYNIVVAHMNTCVYIQIARKCPIQTLSRWMNKIPLHEM